MSSQKVIGKRFFTRFLEVRLQLSSHHPFIYPTRLLLLIAGPGQALCTCFTFLFAKMVTTRKILLSPNDSKCEKYFLTRVCESGFLKRLQSKKIQKWFVHVVFSGKKNHNHYSHNFSNLIIYRTNGEQSGLFPSSSTFFDQVHLCVLVLVIFPAQSFWLQKFLLQN